jgi:hypothetical protein
MLYVTLTNCLMLNECIDEIQNTCPIYNLPLILTGFPNPRAAP